MLEKARPRAEGAEGGGHEGRGRGLLPRAFDMVLTEQVQRNKLKVHIAES